MLQAYQRINRNSYGGSISAIIESQIPLLRQSQS